MSLASWYDPFVWRVLRLSIISLAMVVVARPSILVSTSIKFTLYAMLPSQNADPIQSMRKVIHCYV
ncbi:hypothetical protein MITS9509_02032 [Synechococcus sp. MIT S9509]|nr:hypothetical protein MITS9509_02032 [Synechococcus sp. MIT S9509]